jgi:lactoylglutathione lyase
VRAIRFNHVSISAVDMEESLRFYTEIFGMERLPSPDFADHVEWLRLGDQQLHLFRDDAAAPQRHHISLDVDDFEAAYLKAKELGVLEERTFGAARRCTTPPADRRVPLGGGDDPVLDSAAWRPA